MLDETKSKVTELVEMAKKELNESIKGATPMDKIILGTCSIISGLIGYKIGKGNNNEKK